MELWDVYDQDRNKKGYTTFRTNALIGDDYHLVVHVCIFNNKNQMLIQKRKANKANWPNKWDVSAGGAALSGETSCVAAERELLEELGINISLEHERPIITVHFDHGFDDYYTIVINDDTISCIQYADNEIEEIRWATFDDIVTLIHHGEFDILQSFIELVFAMKDKRGNHYN